ncbi:hypothetical protein BDC45DRAFT_499980 [Circinella umbellata]|nr:hypothetical protein BDC45DRAFT_499980 [Circinella umbellata]
MTFSNLAISFTKSQLHCHSFQQCYENAQLQFTQGHLQEAELSLTNATDTINSTMSMVLLNRAIIRGMQGNMDGALKDAYKVIDITPLLPEAYLCAGALLSLDQRLADALRLYRAGTQKITSVVKSNKNNNNYDEKKLLELRQTTNDLQLEIDTINAHIFKKLPQEIMSRIIELLSYRERLLCAATCHRWRSQLYNNLTKTMWHDLDFVESLDLETLNLQLGHVMDHPEYIQRISLSSRCDARMTYPLLQFLTQCTRVEVLEIRVQIDNDHNTRYALYQALKSNRLSLKKVVVRCSLSCMMVGIINSCPRLNELLFDSTDSYSNVPQIRGLRSMHRFPTITNNDNSVTVNNISYQPDGDDTEENEYEDHYFDKLELMFLSEPLISYKPGSSITRLEVVNTLFDTLPDLFWQQFPSLQHLTVRISFIIGLSTLIHDILYYCPDIKTLDLGQALINKRQSSASAKIDFLPLPAITNYYNKRLPFFDNSNKDKKKGLVSFNLLCQIMMGNLGSNKELADLINYNSDTLESVHIRPRIICGEIARNIDSNYDDSDNLLEVLPSMVTHHLYSLTRLRDFGLHGYMTEYLDRVGIDLGNIVRNCPMLESLAFEDISIRDTDMFQIATHCKNLRRFRLVLGQPHDYYTVASMKHFLNHTEAKLEDIYLDGSWTLDDEALKILGTKHRSHLKSLALLNCNTVTMKGLSTFVNALVGEEKSAKQQEQLQNNNNSFVMDDHDHGPQLHQLSLYHLNKDIDIQQCIDQIIAPLIEMKSKEMSNNEEKRELQLLQGFDWVTDSPPPKDNKQLINSLERVTSIMRNRTKNSLNVHTLYGTRQYWLFTCEQEKNVTSKYFENIPLSKLRHTM